MCCLLPRTWPCQCHLSWNPHGHGGAAGVPLILPSAQKVSLRHIRRFSLHKRLLRSQHLNWVNCHSGRGWSQSYSSQGPCQLAKQPASEGHGHIGRYRRLHKKICEGGKHATLHDSSFPLAFHVSNQLAGVRRWNKSVFSWVSVQLSCRDIGGGLIPVSFIKR